jgi:hypothetical protein
MSNLFKTLEYEAFRKGINPRTKESREWFRKRMAGINTVNRNQLMKEEPVEIKNSTAVGSMYMFFYKPKHKDKLPYYDSFPLVIILGPATGGFLGLNLHYLPPVLRAKFLDALLDVTSNSKYDETTKFRLSYGVLHYLTAQLASKFAKVPAPEWEIATFLPTADWQKGTSAQVYKDSRKIING